MIDKVIRGAECGRLGERLREMVVTRRKAEIVNIDDAVEIIVVVNIRTF